MNQYQQNALETMHQTIGLLGEHQAALEEKVDQLLDWAPKLSEQIRELTAAVSPVNKSMAGIWGLVEGFQGDLVTGLREFREELKPIRARLQRLEDVVGVPPPEGPDEEPTQTKLHAVAAQ